MNIDATRRMITASTMKFVANLKMFMQILYHTTSVSKITMSTELNKKGSSFEEPKKEIAVPSNNPILIMHSIYAEVLNITCAVESLAAVLTFNLTAVTG